MTTFTGYEFQLALEGADCRYVISQVYEPDGSLRRLSISQAAPEDEPGQTINIEIDPNVFRQTALPGPEVLSRIAIGQALQDNLFGAAGCREGLLLDFAVEPWEGELIESVDG